MTTHALKVDYPYMDSLVAGLKPFEVRRNDRGFQTGDYLALTEDCPPGKHPAPSGRSDCSDCYVQRVVTRRITYVYTGRMDRGSMDLAPGFVVLGLECAQRHPQPTAALLPEGTT